MAHYDGYCPGCGFPYPRILNGGYCEICAWCFYDADDDTQLETPDVPASEPDGESK